MNPLIRFPKNKQNSIGMIHWLILLGSTGGTLLALTWGLLVPDWFGEGRYLTGLIPLGDVMPKMETNLPPSSLSAVSAPAGRKIAEQWSSMEVPDWKRNGKVTSPRVLLAKLANGVDVEAANDYLRSIEPWSGAGSTWAFHRGDYDFSLVTLTTLLYMFGNQPDRLFPETREHLLNVLLNQDGGHPLVTAPRTFGLILDTENHHLMTEGSRYLKNQWLTIHGTPEERANPRYNNRENGMEVWLVAYLEEMLHEGVYEFNSRPYIGYTLQALLNLEAYPESEQIRSLARYLLDIINLQYALGSLDLRRYPPFRRQYRRAEDTALNSDAHTAYMRIWTGSAIEEASSYSSFMLLAELLPYRLPVKVRDWTLSKPKSYFVRYGRGSSACPELYSGGPGYLISAGGANRGWRSRIIARPVTLMLADGETDITRCFHIPGKGHWRRWNTTGVYRNFAVANAPAVVPEQYKATAAEDGWQIFCIQGNIPLAIAVYTSDDLGIIVLFPDAKETPTELLAVLKEKNPEPEVLRGKFIGLDGDVLEYDPEAPKGTWVMKSHNNNMLDRDYDAWPQISGDLTVSSFAR